MDCDIVDRIVVHEIVPRSVARRPFSKIQGDNGHSMVVVLVICGVVDIVVVLGDPGGRVHGVCLGPMLAFCVGMWSWSIRNGVEWSEGCCQDNPRQKGLILSIENDDRHANHTYFRESGWSCCIT